MSNDEKPVRWTQTHQYNLHGLKVGVMNVFEKDGAVVAQVSVWNPRTRSGNDVIVRAGEEIEVAEQRYRVVAIELAQGDVRAWVDVMQVPTLH